MMDHACSRTRARAGRCNSCKSCSGTNQRRKSRTKTRKADGWCRGGWYRARLRFGGSPPQHADAFPALLTLAFLSLPPLLPSGPTFFGELTWMWQHSLAAEAGVSYGMRGEYGGGGGRMRPMSKAGNHAGQQATLRLLWKSPHVMRSGALRNALPSRTCVNVPVVVGGRQWTIDVFVCLCIFVSTPPFKS